MDPRPPMTLARFRSLLDAYGARPDRWPPDERESACALLEGSPQARHWHAASAQLDGVLDMAPAATATSALVDRIMDATPRRPDATPRRPAATGLRLASAQTRLRPVRRAAAWRYVGAALSLAAAATLVLWLRTQPLPAPEATNISLAEIGTYTAPTDELLEVPGVQALDRVPAFGCTDSGLGCLDPGVPNDQSQSTLESERYV
jgi:hypothetical protein